MLGRIEQRPRDRVHLKKETQVRVASVAVNAEVLSVTFDMPVVLRGTPGYTTDVAGATVVSASSPAPNVVVEMTFSATIAAATAVTIPVLDPAIRSKVGGYVADTYFPVTP